MNSAWNCRLPIVLCAAVMAVTSAGVVTERPKKDLRSKPTRRRRSQQRGSDWNKNFDLKKGPKVWHAAQESGCRREQAVG